MNFLRLHSLTLCLFTMLPLSAPILKAEQPPLVDRRAFFGEVLIAGRRYRQTESN